METKELISTMATEVKNFQGKFNDSLKEVETKSRELNDRMLTLEQASPGSYTPESENGNTSKVNKDLGEFIRTAGETKGLSIVGGGTAGGNAVIPFTSSTLEALLHEGNPFRDLITIQMVGGNSGFEELVSSGAAGATYTGETDARPETVNPVLNKIVTDLMEIYSLQTLTQRLLSQSFIDLSDWISSEMAISIAETESTAFISGTGAGNEPLGLNNQTFSLLSDKGGRPFGEIQKIVSGDAALLVDMDALKEALYALKAGYRANSVWVMNSLTALTVSKFKDTAGNYIWSESTQVGEPSMLLGRPVQIIETVSDIGAGALPIFLADWNQAYRFITGADFQVQPDPYSNKPHVDFYGFFYSGFALRKSEAIKAISIEV